MYEITSETRSLLRVRSLAVLVVFILSVLHIPSTAAQQPAFPGAEGFGRYAEGGRGGDVYKVTNLNDSGPGSLRYGIESADGPRTIVFGVSGTIFLESGLRLENPYTTIAGQTAPGGGITLATHQFTIAADHVIVRYMRFRLGDLAGPTSSRSPIRIASGTNIIVDHVSASWGINETLSTSSPSYAAVDDIDLVTIQWSMITEGLYESVHPKGRRAYGGVIRARRESLHHNLYAHNNARSPKIAWRSYIQADFRNNVIYNWGNNPHYDGSLAHVNWVNNYSKPGPATPTRTRQRIFQIENKAHYDPERWAAPDGDEEITPHFYIEGNYMEGSPGVTADNWNGGVSFALGGSPEHRAHEPHNYPIISYEKSPLEAYKAVLAHSGASLYRDAVDRRIIEEVRNGTATFGGVYGERSGIIDSQDDVGGWPDLISTEPPVDSDGDGMPDWWEIEHGLDPNDPAEGNRDRNGDGYTNLEEYINWLADPQGLYLDRHPAINL